MKVIKKFFLKMDCPICIEPLNNEEIETTECNHTFHKRCLDDWKKISKSCPYCRRKTDGTYISEEEKRELLEYYNSVDKHLKEILPESNLIPMEDIDMDTYGHYYRDMFRANKELTESYDPHSYVLNCNSIIGKMIDDFIADDDLKATINNIFNDYMIKLLSLTMDEKEERKNAFLELKRQINELEIRNEENRNDYELTEILPTSYTNEERENAEDDFDYII